MRVYGHSVEWIDGKLRYQDTGELVPDVPTRACPQCHKSPTPEGHDACLGTIPGVIAACCGHGVDTGYILWERANTAEIEIELPRWLCALLRLLGYGSFISSAKPLSMGLRHYYAIEDVPEDIALSG